MKKYKTPVLFIDGTVDKMAICEVETEDDGTPLKVTIIRSTGLEGNANFCFGVDDNPWISVNERLPELMNGLREMSIDVDAEDSNGKLYKQIWYHYGVGKWSERGSWFWITNIVRWRYIKEQTND